MRRPDREAFTLVELLVVIVIVGLLLALLVPAATLVWESAQATRCRSNLQHLWQAQCVFRADTKNGALATGMGWTGRLLPYVEGRVEVFTCPGSVMSSVALAEAEAAGENWMAIGLSQYLSIMKYGNQWQPEFEIPLTWDFQPSSSSQNSVRRRSAGGNSYIYDYEDGGDTDWQDIRVQVRFKGGMVQQVNVLMVDTSEHNFDLMLNGDVYQHDLAVVGGFYSADDGSPRGGNTREWVFDSTGLVITNYGMSQGAFESPGVKAVGLDSRLFFILDYPKELADYNRYGGEDDWSQFFILDAEAWEERYGENLPDGTTWLYYQALRHGGRANVLFGDGHVEALGVASQVSPDEILADKVLDETSACWR